MLFGFLVFAQAATGYCSAYEDETLNYCAVCSLSTEVRVVLPSMVICAPYTGTTCTLNSSSNVHSYTYSLVTLPNSPYEKICYSKILLLYNVTKIGITDLTGCSTVEDGIGSLSSTASNYTTWLFSNSYGCGTCNSGYKRKA